MTGEKWLEQAAPEGWVYADDDDEWIITYQIKSRIKDYLKKGENNRWRIVREYSNLGTAEDDLLVFFQDSDICEYRIFEVTQRLIEKE